MITPECVVIGGGVAGLSAGIFALKEGWRVTLLEQTDRLGGQLTGWDRDGFRIDNSIHWLNGSFHKSDQYRLWEAVDALGGQIPMRRLPYFSRSEGEGGCIEFSRDPEQTRISMHRLAPEDSRWIDRFIDAAEAYAATVTRRDASNIQLGSRFLPFLGMDLASLGEKFTHPLLRAAFTDYFGGRITALAFLISYGDFIAGNADIPVGGSVPMAERMVARFRSLGGKIHTNTKASKIITEQHRPVGVESEKGEIFSCNRVFCCCDPYATFHRLLPTDAMPDKLQMLFEKSERYPLFSALQAAFSVDSDSRIPVGENTFPIRDFQFGGKNLTRLSMRNYSYEPDFAPDGKTVLQIMLPLCESEAAAWICDKKDKEGYRQRKESFAAEIKARIVEKYPFTASSVKLLDVWTPASYHSRFGTPCGSFLSFIPTAKGIVHSIDPVLPKYPGIYLATQWMHLPGGLPGACRAGWEAVRAAAIEEQTENAWDTVRYG